MDEEGELHQYVIYEQAKPKGPKIIKLDNPKGKNSEMEKYTPPTSITVHLSKIDMPELKPRTTGQSPDKNLMKEKGKPTPPNRWAQPLHQQSGALNTATPPPPPPQLGSVVSGLMGRLDRFAKR
jgi:hypothetical protein